MIVGKQNGINVRWLWNRSLAQQIIKPFGGFIIDIAVSLERLEIRIENLLHGWRERFIFRFSHNNLSNEYDEETGRAYPMLSGS